MGRLAGWLRKLPLLLISPLVIASAALALAITDLLWWIAGRKTSDAPRQVRKRAATVVIPNWNGRELLEKYLPSVIEALAGNSENEILVVDNGSTDGSADLLSRAFPHVRVLALEKNLGFGGGSNAGIRAARNDIVVLLNSDMRVAPDFLRPLIESFTDEQVFAVSCQILFSDPKKVREETGLTQGWWANGGLRVRHRIDPNVRSAYPCFYGGGGSCAFDRAKFLELGGFDDLLAPFYLEDTDLGYMAWKRGWKVLYEPRSVVWHEHRGTIGRRFTDDQIQAVLKKNFILWTWKNIHDWPRLVAHFAFTWADGLVSLALGDSPERSNLAGLWRAFLQLGGATRSRWRAKSLAAVDDTEAFRRPLGGYFRDRFDALPADPDRLGVLFVSPYPICPPIHGGGVFMYQTIRELARLCDLHVIALLDYPNERKAHEELIPLCASLEFLVRMEGKTKAFGSIMPHSVEEFWNQDLEWLIHRQIYTQRIDVVQLEYTNMGQYAAAFRQLTCILFEHDVYFQSIGRALAGARSPVWKLQAAFEYLRAMRYELRMLPKLDRIQVCSRANGDYLASFLPELVGRMDDGLRAGIDVSRYEFRPDGREPATMLFLGSFRHLPNQEALNWFTRQVLPRVLDQRADARLVIVGADPPPRHSLPELPGAIELRGFVEEVREPLARYAVFVCPILSGSGMRVKLLEAFAAGIPCVSTRLGAEGLAEEDGLVCSLADSPEEFAAKVVRLFDDPEEAAAMARRARLEVETKFDLATMTERLTQVYWSEIRRKRGTTSTLPVTVSLS
jgi:GT2 family glycosyltransferase